MIRTCVLVLSLCLVMAGCGDKSSSSTTGPTPVAPAPAPTPLWSAAGTGNDVFNKPLSATRLRITGSYPGNASNFIVFCGTSLLVNELLGTGFGPLTYSGTHATPNCSQIEIRNSTGVAWTLTEVR